MHSSTFNFDRVIPDLPWRRLAISAALITLVAAIAWEMRARSLGYAPTLNNSSDLWAQERSKLQPDSIVVIGDSRALFDVDLDVMERGLGRRPLQLALVGSCAYPILADLASDECFHGTVICSLLPAIWLAPAGPPMEASRKALKYWHGWTPAQRASHELAMLLEERIACLKSEDLTLKALLKKAPIPNRPYAQVPPLLPPYFSTMERDRQTRMAEACAVPGPLQDRVKSGWPPHFTPPPPPSYVPKEAFANMMHSAVEQRFNDTADAVHKLQARGGKVIFIRFPMSGALKELEGKATPRQGPWTRIINQSGAPGIYFEDYPELSKFECPEWSHLSGPQATEFTQNLMPHLLKALGKDKTP
jgi:hypothetical protein